MLRSTFLVLVLAGLAVADTQTGSVKSGGQAIPGAAVTAECGGEKISTVTDETGRFELGGLPANPCKFSIAMFGFEPAQAEAKPSETPLGFDLKLQTRATLPAEPGAPVASTAERPAFRQRPGGGPGRGGFAGAGPGRGGFPQPGAGARGGGAQAPGGRGGFQNLNLVQNTEPSPDANEEIAPSPTGAPDDATGSNEAFLVNGSLSQGVQA
jgi:hypothetical protein